MATSFYPKPGANTSIAPAGATASGSVPAECPQIRFLWVPTTPGNRCQVRWGVGAQTATTSDMQLVENMPEAFTKGPADTVAVIGTGTLYITCGTGD